MLTSSDTPPQEAAPYLRALFPEYVGGDQPPHGNAFGAAIWAIVNEGADVGMIPTGELSKRLREAKATMDYERNRAPAERPMEDAALAAAHGKAGALEELKTRAAATKQRITSLELKMREFDSETDALAKASVDEEVRPEDRNRSYYQEQIAARRERLAFERSRERQPLQTELEAARKELRDAEGMFRGATSPGRLTRRGAVTKSADGKMRHRERQHETLFDRQSEQELGTFLFKAKGANFLFEPSKKLPKDTRAAIVERFRGTVIDAGLQERANEIVEFVREYEAGRKDRERTIEGQVTGKTETTKPMRDELPAPEPGGELANLNGLIAPHGEAVVVAMRKIASFISHSHNGESPRSVEGYFKELQNENEDWWKALDLIIEGAHPDIDIGLRDGRKITLFLANRKPNDVTSAAELEEDIRPEGAPWPRPAGPEPEGKAAATRAERGLENAATDWEARKREAQAQAGKNKAATVIATSRSKRRALICAMCSGTKDAAEGKIPAEQRYAPGSVVNSMAKIPEHLRPDILFLSAEFGLIGHDTPIPHYEKKLTKAEADKLIKRKSARDKFVATVRDYDGGKVLIAAGGEYRRVFEAWVEAGTSEFKGIDIEFAPAEVGLMRGAIKAFAVETQPSQAHKEFAKAKATKGERRAAPELSPLAKRRDYRQAVKQLADSFEIGGSIAFMGPDKGYTQSANPDFAQAIRQATGLSYAELKGAARKLLADEKLTFAETDAINSLIDVVKAERDKSNSLGWRQLRALKIQTKYDELLEAYSLNLEFGDTPAETKQLLAELDALRRKYPQYFAVNTAASVSEPLDTYRVEHRVEKGAWREGRVLTRDHIALLPAEQKALAAFLKGRPDRARILKMLEQHRGTPWAKQAIEGIFTRQAAIELMAGNEPAFVSALDDPRSRHSRRLLKLGPEGLRIIMETNGLLSEATKPVNNISSSFVNCRPSSDCARYCYATGGNYQHTNVIIKGELVTLAVESGEKWVADLAAREYKATREFVDKKALRLFDKGDLGEGWVEFVKKLNAEGVRVQIFSRRPELLRQIPESNVRMLSIDESNLRLADENLDLPVAYIYSGKEQIDAVAKLHKRGQIQVILPIKQGQAVLTKDNVLELRKAVDGIAPYICPIDAGYKPLMTNRQPTGWNCTKCDAKGGLGCFFGQPTKGMIAQAYPAQHDRAADMLELRRLLDEYAQPDAETDAEAGQSRAGQPARHREQIDALLARLLAEYEKPGEAGGGQEPDGRARPQDGRRRKGTGSVGEEAAGYGAGGRWFSPLHRAIQRAKLTKGSAEQWLGYLQNQPGVKPEELADVYLTDLLHELSPNNEPITRDALDRVLSDYRVELDETVLVNSTSHYAADEKVEAAIELLHKSGISVHVDDSLGTNVVEFYDSEANVVTPEDFTADEERPIVNAMRVVGRGKDALANFEEYAITGGEDYFELVIQVPTLPVEKRRRDLNDAKELKYEERQARLAQIREPIFQRWNEQINRANTIFSNHLMGTALATELPPAFELRETKHDYLDGPGYALGLYHLEDYGGDKADDLVSGLPYRAMNPKVLEEKRVDAKRRLMGDAWSLYRDMLERRRDSEVRDAIAAAGLSEAGRSKYTPLEYRESHFGGSLPNIVVHVRAKTRRTAEGDKVLAIEEVQSDLHKRGRKKGYRDETWDPDAEDKTLEVYRGTRARLFDLLAAEGDLGYDSGREAIAGLEVNLDEDELPGDWAMSDALRKAALEHRAAARAYKKAAASDDEGPPRAPFQKSYNLLAMKRMLRWAAEHGFDAVAWTPGDVQAVRYNALTHVDAVRLVKDGEHRVIIEIRKKDSERNIPFERLRSVPRAELADWIGGGLATEGLRQLDATADKIWHRDPIIKTQIMELGRLGITPINETANAYQTPDGALHWSEFDGANLPSLTDKMLDDAHRLVREVHRKVGHQPRLDESVTLEQSTTVGNPKGYRDLYDNILRQDVGKFVKKMGGSVERLETADNEEGGKWLVALPDGTTSEFDTRWKAEKLAESLGVEARRAEIKYETNVWHGVRLNDAMREQLMQPLAIYEQRDLFGIAPGSRPPRPAGDPPPRQQGDMLGLVDPKAQAEADRKRALAAAVDAKGVKLRGDKSVPADLGKAGDLFTTQQDLLDAAAKIPERPGTTDAQRATRADAIRELERRLGGNTRGIQVLASELPQDFLKAGSVQLVGAKVTSRDDLAVAAQVYRDPRFETLRWIAVKDGKVVYETGLSSRLAGAVHFSDIQINDIQRRLFTLLTAAKADGWYLLHNHPSGESAPSDADVNVTRAIAKTLNNFLGHVVIDHDEYSTIEANGERRKVKKPGLHSKTYSLDKPIAPHTLLGVSVTNSNALAAVAGAAFTGNANVVTIIGTNYRGPVRSIINVKVDQLKGARGIALLRRLMRLSGSARLFAIVEADFAPLEHLLKNGILMDAYAFSTDVDWGDQHPIYMTGTWYQVRVDRESKGGRVSEFGKAVREGGEDYGTANANPVSFIYRRYQRAAQTVIDRWNEKIGWRWDALGKLPRKEDYLTARYATLGKLTRVREVGRDIYDTLAEATPADATAIYDYLTTPGAQPTAISDPVIRRKAVAVKKLIDRIGRTLVMRGMLSSQAYARYKDGYLPRIYLKHVLDEGAFSALGAGRRLSDLGYLKRRKNLGPDERILLGEILDPAFLASHGTVKPMRDLAIVDFLDALAGNRDWVAPQSLVMWHGRRVSAFWLKREADSLRQRAELYGPQNKAFAQNVANQMDTAANAALASLANVSDDFKQLPDSPRYGILRGAWVRKEIHADLTGAMQAIPSDSPAVSRLFEYGGVGSRITQLWKQSKVAMNPPAQVRNFLSNMVLAHLSGVSMVRLPVLYVRAVNELRTHGKYWRIARKYGLFESTFTNTELLRIEEEWLDLQRRLGTNNPMATMKAMAGILANKTSDLYQLSESIGKIAKLIDGMEQDGLTESQAMIEAHKWLFDYSLVPKTVGYLRNAPIGVPFITFYYKATARLGEALIKHPGRFLPYIALGAVMTAMLKDEWDIDEEEAEKLRQAMPNWIRERSHVWIMPWKDREGRWQVFDFGYLLPWAVHTEVLRAMSTGDLKKAAEVTGIANGPIPSLFVAWKTGIDPFSKREIFPANASKKEQLLALLDYTWTLAAPPFITSRGWLGKTIDAATGKVNPRTGDPGLTQWQAQLRLLGLNVYPVDPLEARLLNIRLFRREIEDVEQALGKRLRDRNLTPEEKTEIRTVYRAIIRQKQADLEEYQKASAFPRRLMEPTPPASQEPEA